MINLYKIFFTIFFPSIILVLSLFSKKIRFGTKQKFGFYDFKLDTKTFWIHAVSVGEINALSDFIKNNADKNIVLTTSTPQGFELANNKLSSYCNKICYFPYDITCAVNKAIKAINPYAIMIFETEIWPNFSKIVKSKNIPLFIANGRISDSTYKTYQKLKFLFKEVFNCFYGILAQSEEDKNKFIDIGASPNIVQNMGNIKFDIVTPDNNIKNELSHYYQTGFNHLIVAGSTHTGEDEIAINLFKKLQKISNVKLIIAPRHLERVQNIAALLKKNNCKYALKTENKTFKDVDIILLNTTGELSKIYSISRFSVIFGSFDKTGGHNPLEATVWGIPVISGNNIKNFKVIYRELTKNNCAKIVNNEEELYQISKKLIEDDEFYKTMCINSKKTIEDNKGATNILEKYIEDIKRNEN